MSTYLLDTNCFYAVSKNTSKQQKLRSMESNVTTSGLAVLEIARISRKPGDFEKRKMAMKALYFINPLIHQKTPDDIVARAFGQPEPQIETIDYNSIIRTLLLAKSYVNLIDGVVDPLYRRIYKINPDVLHEWKRSVSSYFTNAVVFGNKKMIEMLVTYLGEKYGILNQKEKRLLSKHLTAMSSQHEKAFSFTLAGLSVRAGLHTEEQLNHALLSNTIEDLVESAKCKYDGSLDSYVKMYLSFQKYLSPGRTPEKNALFDLEFFLHLDAHGAPYTFVTTELLWLELGKSALPGRVKALEDII
jgi:hypothetical protein